MLIKIAPIFLRSFVLFTLLGNVVSVLGQTYTPIYHWTFDGKDPFLDKKTQRPWINPSNHDLANNQGLLGNYFDFSSGPTERVSFPLAIQKQISLEFWIKAGPDGFNKSQILFFFNDRKASISFAYPNIKFSTLTKVANGKIIPHNLNINLSGTGKEGLDYYMDDAWHHFVFQYHGGMGIKEIWIDGELLPNLTSKDAPKGTLCSGGDCAYKRMFFTQESGSKAANFTGSIDEIALYNRTLPPQLIQQHVREIKNKKHYSFVAVKSRRTLPSEVSSQVESKAQTKEIQQIDLKEFAKNHPNVKESAINQLRSFPLPRYKKGHQLTRNINWMDLNYFGGFKTPNLVRNAVSIQEELVLNWNYHLLVGGTRAARKDKQGNLAPMTKALIALANKYPNIPLAVIVLWAQVVPKDIGLKDAGPKIYQKHADFALKNARGQMISATGKPGAKDYFMSPSIPAERFKSDGKLQAKYLNNLIKELRRPIDLINENGETPFLPYPSSTLEKDPREVKYKAKIKAKNWDTYQAIQKNRLRNTYSQEFLKLPALKNTRFTWYGVDAGPQDRFEWETARLIHTKVNGQYYSTPDFYVRWPHNWHKVQGAWRGWSWIETSRKIEIEAGDKLFSPFVAAGWNHNPEKNVRPSQWLGLLKCLGPVGAEFFYPGFFNINKTIADPANYAWQAIMPAYAQAITSQYEGLLRRGNVLMDEKGTPIIRIPTGDPRVLATARKYNSQYILALTLQPQSNIKGNVPDELAVKLNIDGHNITCMARRQGSVYFMDMSKQSSPIFYQLDTWHQNGHPAWWTEDFAFEAEVPDYSMGQEIHTETKMGAQKGDFRSFDTYFTSIDDKACSKYHFQPRKNNATYQLRVRARSNSGNRGKIGIILDGTELGEINNIKSGDWQWYELSSKIKNLSAKDHMLSLLQSDQRVEIDKFVLLAK